MMDERYSRLLTIVFGLVLIDQIAKLIALVGAQPGGIFVLVRNTGITFGFFQGANTVMIGISLIAAVVIGYTLSKAKMVDAVGLVLLLAGVIGNLLDRVFRQAVIDFISIGTFPVFNLADSMIVSGIIYLLVVEIPAVRKKLEKITDASA